MVIYDNLLTYGAGVFLADGLLSSTAIYLFD